MSRRHDSKKPPFVCGGLGLLAGVLLGAGGGIFFFPHTVEYANSGLRLSDLSQQDAAYRYIDPLLALKNQNTDTPPEFKSLESDLTSFINSEKSKGNLKEASVYFREVGHQGGITLNPTEQYYPSSLLKVPTMMVYYKLAENTPSILNDKLVYSGDTDANLQEHIKSPVTLAPGHAYTVEELIEHMIRYSDNNAAEMLVNHLNETNHEEVFNDLFRDLGITQIDLTNDYITTNVYVLFFRVLYNSTYLSRDMSEKAMELLTTTDFTQGIVAGLGDKSVPVAHKFGEFTVNDQSGKQIKQELHDCGFVYYPLHTYTLCIMTEGNDLSKLAEVLQGISSRVYNTVVHE